MNIFSKNPERCGHILELLTMNGVKVNQKNHDHWAPLHTAVRKGQEKGVNAIIKLNKKLAAKNLEQFDLNIAGGIQQWSSLHLAAHASQLQIIVDLTRAGADIFQRNQTNQSARHCAKGNYIMTKNIKLIEQQSLAEEFRIFKLNDARLLVTSAKEQQILKMQQTNSQNTPPQTNLFKDSRMQPIKAEDKNESMQGQKDSRQQQ